MKYILRVRARLVVAIPVMAALVSSGWGGAGGKDPVGPTVPTEAPAPSTTAPPDVSTVPAVIDEAYLNAVLKELNRVDGDASNHVYTDIGRYVVVVTVEWVASWSIGERGGTVRDLRTSDRIEDFEVRQLQAVRNR